LDPLFDDELAQQDRFLGIHAGAAGTVGGGVGPVDCLLVPIVHVVVGDPVNGERCVREAGRERGRDEHQVEPRLQQRFARQWRQVERYV
jgi:hypothetical protein